MGDSPYVCPECGEERMVKEGTQPGWYRLKCQACGAERGPFQDVEDRSVA